MGLAYSKSTPYILFREESLASYDSSLDVMAAASAASDSLNQVPHENIGKEKENAQVAEVSKFKHDP
jgi:hypothetical protein